jgi:hypothetical protein
MVTPVLVAAAVPRGGCSGSSGSSGFWGFRFARQLYCCRCCCHAPGGGCDEERGCAGREAGWLRVAVNAQQKGTRPAQGKEEKSSDQACITM